MKGKLIKLQKDYSALYKKGLVGISTSYIQVEPALFKELSGGAQIIVDNNDNFELSCVIDNIKFVTLI